jgi:hypothetical protein
MKQIYNGKQETTFHTFNSAFIDKNFIKIEKELTLEIPIMFLKNVVKYIIKN